MKVFQWSFHFFTFYIFCLLVKHSLNAMCHSSCAPGDTTSLACASNNDPTQCKNCYSNNVVFYPTPQTAGTPRECIPNATSTAHLNIDKLQFIIGNTILGNSYLKSYMIFGTSSVSTADTLANLLLFSANTLPFDVTTSPIVILNFLGLGTDHYAVYIRANAQTDCTSSPLFKIGVGASIASSALAASTPTVVESALINHVTNGLTVELQFDFSGATCAGTDLAWV
jgi:hypothetical protein